MTPGNRLLLVTAVIVGPLAALAGLGVVSAGVCAAGVAALAAVAGVDAVLGNRRLDRISVTLPDVLRTVRGRVLEVRAMVKNGNAEAVRARMALELPGALPAEEAVVSIELPPGNSEVGFHLTPRERGRHTIGQVHFASDSPLRAWVTAAARTVRCEVRTYPDMRDQPASLLMLRRNPSGARVARPVGRGREFEKLRDYAPGDSFDEICWKATARRSRPVVKLFQTEHSQEVYAVVDASRLSARGDTLERYVNGALHLLITAQRNGDRVGLITFSDQVHKLVRAGGTRIHFRACRDAIYDLQPRRVSPDYSQLFTAIQLSLRKRSLLVFLTALDDPVLAESFIREVPLIARRHLVLVNVLRDPGVAPLFSGAQAPELYEGLAGQLMWNKLIAVERSLRSIGVQFKMLEPAGVESGLSAMYLDVKRRRVL